MRRFRSAFGFRLVFLGALAGCGGGGGGGGAPPVEPSPKVFAYAANSGSNDVTEYSIDPSTGALTVIGTVPAGQEPWAIAATPSGEFVYVLNDTSDDVSAYAVEASTGKLQPIGTYDIRAAPGEPAPQAIAVDPTGSFLYTANTGTYDVSAFRIDAITGALTAVGDFLAGSSPCSLAFHPSGQFLYAVNLGSHDITAYAIHSTTGVPSLVLGGPFPTGTLAPNLAAVDPSGRFLYATDLLEANTNVLGFTIAPDTGALTAIAGFPEVAVAQARALAIDPSGKYLYVANDDSNEIAGYALDAATGTLTPLAGSPFLAGTPAYAIVFDPTGKFVYLADNVSSVHVATFDAASGALAETAESPFEAGGSPMSFVTVKR